ncbi:MAG TPA: hypothetical protein VHE34_26370 [Puia sp.]|uniref:hypothetical protein n=1 Tax=Puia sp. TaxID=2045100 RepID=UPI002C80EBE2|nr:hypothetical protein [Puia sp.]HVU98786.1 hypothetical protein [Puia sp.]
MELHALITDLNQTHALQLREVAAIDELESLLAERVNTMIQRDFGALVQLLYRVDVSESKLRGLLQENAGEDAARVIARLIIERQWQKIETRRRYRRDVGGDEERW